MIELLIKNGTVVDGTGRPPQKLNIGIKGQRITCIGTDCPPAHKEIDATGKFVFPGFIDVHTHYDAQITWDPNLEPHSLHGFTTVLGGNCGFSLAPISDASAEYLLPMLSKVEAIPLETLQTGTKLNWHTTGEMHSQLDGNVAVNIGFATGHCALRSYVMGDRAVGGASTPDDVAKMKALLRESLEQGSLGFTSSFAQSHRDHQGQGVPSLAADRSELMELAATVRDYEGTYLGFVSSVNIMSQEDKELLADFSVAGDRTVNWPLLIPGALSPEDLENQLSTADVARAKGGEVRVQCSSMPIEARVNFRNGLGYDFFPGIWGELYQLPIPQRIERLKDRDTREQMRAAAAEVAATSNPVAVLARFETFEVLAAKSEKNQQYIGRKVADIAKETDSTPFDVCLDIAIEDELETAFLVTVMGSFDKPGWELLTKCLTDDRTIWGATDGGAHVDVLEAYSHATRFLAGAVRDHKVMPIEQAINLFTKVPAEFIGIRDRGVLQEGAYADILIVDMDKLACKTMEVRSDLPAGGMRLYTAAEGYDAILVNGEIIAEKGEYTQRKPGVVLRANKDTYTVRPSTFQSSKD